MAADAALGDKGTREADRDNPVVGTDIRGEGMDRNEADQQQAAEGEEVRNPSSEVRSPLPGDKPYLAAWADTVDGWEEAGAVETGMADSPAASVGLNESKVEVAYAVVTAAAEEVKLTWPDKRSCRRPTNSVGWVFVASWKRLEVDEALWALEDETWPPEVIRSQKLRNIFF